MSISKTILFLILINCIFLDYANAQPVEAHAQLRVMTYNIRYDNPDDGINAWDRRKVRVSNLISFYSPAIFGVQEGLLHQLNYLTKNLNNYDWIGVGRNNGEIEGEFSAVFYDTTKVELIDGTEQTFWLSNTPEKPSKSWDAALPRIVTLGKFRLKDSNNSFYLLNTHFDHRGETARIKSAELIMQKISQLPDNLPVVLTGDFNATPESTPYQVIDSNENGIRDALTQSELPHVGPLFTFEGFSVQSEQAKRRIDYIFVSDQVNVKKHAILSTFRDGRYPSDHLPVVADIEIGN